MDLRAQTRLAEAGLPLNVEGTANSFTGRSLERSSIRRMIETETYRQNDRLHALYAYGSEGQEIPPATITLDAKGNEQQAISTNSPSRRWKGKLNSKRCRLAAGN